MSSTKFESDPERDTHTAEFAERVRANQQKLTADLKPHYDFIVCGSGSSGSVVARRLAENAEVSVLRPKADGSDDIIQPDDHLVEANLCKSLGVSRTSLREALRSLQAKRRQAIEQRQHDRRIGHRQWMICSRSRASTFSLSARASISEWRAEPRAASLTSA